MAEFNFYLESIVKKILDFEKPRLLCYLVYMGIHCPSKLTSKYNSWENISSWQANKLKPAFNSFSVSNIFHFHLLFFRNKNKSYKLKILFFLTGGGSSHNQWLIFKTLKNNMLSCLQKIQKNNFLLFLKFSFANIFIQN